MKRKQITPLTQWPTEAIVFLFKKNRVCRTSRPFDGYVEVKNKLTNKIDIWLAVGGIYQTDDGHYNYDILSYELYDGTKEQFLKSITTTSGITASGYLWIKFEGMYWEGNIDELKEELSKRPHCNIHTAKDFRKWKIMWKHNNRK